MILWIDNEAKITVETIETYPLRLPSGFRLDLKDYYFVFVASRNLILISVLTQDGFIFQLKSTIVPFIYEINWLHLTF